ncbi:unnamed protein product [Amoebophrya sp. A25]|nr:unnamed protein product [Amoebophrya sp. A25]|eukprot:GSA25T00011323001.1
MTVQNVNATPSQSTGASSGSMPSSVPVGSVVWQRQGSAHIGTGSTSTASASYKNNANYATYHGATASTAAATRKSTRSSGKNAAAPRYAATNSHVGSSSSSVLPGSNLFGGAEESAASHDSAAGGHDYLVAQHHHQSADQQAEAHQQYQQSVTAAYHDGSAGASGSAAETSYYNYVPGAPGGRSASAEDGTLHAQAGAETAGGVSCGYSSEGYYAQQPYITAGYPQGYHHPSASSHAQQYPHYSNAQYNQSGTYAYGASAPAGLQYTEHYVEGAAAQTQLSQQHAYQQYPTTSQHEPRSTYSSTVTTSSSQQQEYYCSTAQQQQHHFDRGVSTSGRAAYQQAPAAAASERPARPPQMTTRLPCWRPRRRYESKGRSALMSFCMR